MVAARYAYSRGQAFVRGVSTAFAVFFGFVALFFAATPKLWSPGNQPAFFMQNTAHAEVPAGGSNPSGTGVLNPGIGAGGDCSCDSSGGAGAGDAGGGACGDSG